MNLVKCYNDGCVELTHTCLPKEKDIVNASCVVLRFGTRNNYVYYVCANKYGETGIYLDKEILKLIKRNSHQDNILIFEADLLPRKTYLLIKSEIIDMLSTYLGLKGDLNHGLSMGI